MADAGADEFDSCFSKSHEPESSLGEFARGCFVRQDWADPLQHFDCRCFSSFSRCDGLARTGGLFRILVAWAIRGLSGSREALASPVGCFSSSAALLQRALPGCAELIHVEGWRFE